MGAVCVEVAVRPEIEISTAGHHGLMRDDWVDRRHAGLGTTIEARDEKENGPQ
ncbi:MAG TPA: hypothetical protein VGG32_05165 [Thermoplasmata archaeon]|jgi:hypothetical protein